LTPALLAPTAVDPVMEAECWVEAALLAPVEEAEAVTVTRVKVELPET